MKTKDFLYGAMYWVIIAMVNFVAFGGMAPYLVSMKDTVSVIIGGGLLLIVVLYDVLVVINLGEKRDGR